MITGSHVVVYSRDAEADRAFFRDTLGFRFVDAGNGRLFFALPATEAGFHEAEHNDRHEIYLMCDDVEKEIATLRTKGVECAEPQDQGWGVLTRIRLPGGGHIGLYQPRHLRP